MLKIAPGKEEEFRYLQKWLAASSAVERVIEVTEDEGTCDLGRTIDQLTGRCHDPLLA